MFGYIKKMFVVLLSSLVNASNYTKYVSLDNHQFITEPSIINLHPKNIVKNYLTIHLLLIWIDIKTSKHLNLGAFNMVTEISNSSQK